MSVPATPPAAEPVPGRTLGIVGLVLAFLMPLIGAIISGVALSQSKKAGVPNGVAKAGLILGIVFTVLWIIFAIVVAVAGAALFGAIISDCATLGPGVWDVNGTIVTCS